MAKAILVSILLVSVALPVACARDGDPRRGLRRLLASLAAFCVLYLALVTLVYARLNVPEGITR